jgi:Holliday junction resolvase RusA-like endonuclease
MRFEVKGIPVPQGSMKAFVPGGRAVVTHVKAGPLSVWRAQVSLAAKEAGVTIANGAVYLDVDFFVVKPKSVSLAKRPQPCVKPDLDKLLRSVCDALAGIAWNNDSQVVSIRGRKIYAVAPYASPGAIVNIGRAEGAA